jgi:putative transposase
MPVAPRLTQAQKALALRLHRQGLSQREIARQICCNDSTLSIMFREKLSSEGIADRSTANESPDAPEWSQEDRMKKKHHTPEQIIRKVAEGDKLLNQGQDLAEVCRHLEIAESTWHRWKTQYGGMKANDAKRLKELENENNRLKKIAELLPRLEMRWLPPSNRASLPENSTPSDAKRFVGTVRDLLLESPITFPDQRV